VDKKIRKPANPKKIIVYAVVLIAFLMVTNPTLLPFLSPEAKRSIGDVWTSLFGDVDSIIGTFTLSWATLFKLIAMVLLLVLLTAIADYILAHVKPTTGKARSAVTMLQSTVSYLAALVGIFWGLSIVGVNVSTIFASVGVLALIIGFGAESLVADVVTGVFLVFENQFNVGDIIEVGGFRGTVERIGIRTTYIRDSGDNIKIINNSDLRNILNRSAAQSVAMTEVSVSYSEDLERVEKVLAELLTGIQAKYPEVFAAAPVYSGVQSLADSGVVLRITAVVREQDIYKAPRLINRELKIGFDRAGIEIPFPQVVVHQMEK